MWEGWQLEKNDVHREVDINNPSWLLPGWTVVVVKIEKTWRLYGEPFRHREKLLKIRLAGARMINANHNDIDQITILENKGGDIERVDL